MDCSRLQGCVVDYIVLKFKTYIPERNRSRLQVICSRLQRARNACNGYKRLDFESNHSKTPPKVILSLGLYIEAKIEALTSWWTLICKSLWGFDHFLSKSTFELFIFIIPLSISSSSCIIYSLREFIIFYQSYILVRGWIIPQESSWVDFPWREKKEAQA